MSAEVAGNLGMLDDLISHRGRRGRGDYI